MSGNQITSPFDIFTDIDGNPLEDGFVFIGVAASNPETSPIQAYWDSGLTQPAAQPIRTRGGYPSNSGAPSRIYISATFHSIRVKNKNETTVFSDLNASSIFSSSVIFQRPETGAVLRTGEDKFLESPTPQDFGAVADGIMIDSAAYLLTTPIGVCDLTPLANLNIGTTAPSIPIKGSGRFTWTGDEFSGFELSYHMARDSIYSCPQSWTYAAQGNIYPPLGVSGFNNRFHNTFITIDGKAVDPAYDVVQSTGYGAFIGRAPISWLLNTAVGINTMSFAGYAQRCTAVGSDIFVWGGAPSQAKVIEQQHDYFRGTLPNNPAWDVGGLETKFPGIGMRIWNFSSYAASSEDFARNSSFGRDSGNKMVKGNENTFSGYLAGGYGYSVTGNTAMGVVALQNAVFGDNMSAFGYGAGRDALDSSEACFFGYSSGNQLKASPRVTAIGAQAGGASLQATGAVLLGYKAGSGLDGQLTDSLVIATEDSGVRAPLITGNFATQQGGVAIPPASIRAGWHIRNGSASGSVLPLDVGSNGLLIERGANTGLTIETPNSGFGSISFATPVAVQVGAIQYGHASASLQYIAGGVGVGRMTATDWRPGADNTRTLGILSTRWSTTFSTQYAIGAGAVRLLSGTGTPEGVVTAVVGSTFQRSDGGALTSFYVKETGAGNTGWVAK